RPMIQPLLEDYPKVYLLTLAEKVDWEVINGLPNPHALAVSGIASGLYQLTSDEEREGNLLLKVFTSPRELQKHNPSGDYQWDQGFEELRAISIFVHVAKIYTDAQIRLMGAQMIVDQDLVKDGNSNKFARSGLKQKSYKPAPRDWKFNSHWFSRQWHKLDVLYDWRVKLLVIFSSLFFAFLSLWRRYHLLERKLFKKNAPMSHNFDTFDGAQTPPFPGLTARAGRAWKQAPLSINPEHTPAFRPESRRIDFNWQPVYEVKEGRLFLIIELWGTPRKELMKLLSISRDDFNIEEDIINYQQALADYKNLFKQGFFAILHPEEFAEDRIEALFRNEVTLAYLRAVLRRQKALLPAILEPLFPAMKVEIKLGRFQAGRIFVGYDEKETNHVFTLYQSQVSKKEENGRIQEAEEKLKCAADRLRQKQGRRQKWHQFQLRFLPFEKEILFPFFVSFLAVAAALTILALAAPPVLANGFWIFMIGAGVALTGLLQAFSAKVNSYVKRKNILKQQNYDFTLKRFERTKAADPWPLLHLQMWKQEFKLKLKKEGHLAAAGKNIERRYQKIFKEAKTSGLIDDLYEHFVFDGGPTPIYYHTFFAKQMDLLKVLLKVYMTDHPADAVYIQNWLKTLSDRSKFVIDEAEQSSHFSVFFKTQLDFLRRRIIDVVVVLIAGILFG
ncbi:MAG TPA: hypothetical protein VJA17_05590, partial [Candidatus Omnitrophota bacterium]|nr:hypothetical protein [Candidatus Omnitrophota bacterium]